MGELERFEEEIASYNQLLKLYSDACGTWVNRGLALASLEKFEEAIASYDQALKLKPDYIQAWYNRGIAAGSIRFNQSLVSSSPITIQNPILNERGIEGKLASYQEGLKYCQQNTHPEGWGRLHHGIGNIYYSKGELLKIEENFNAPLLSPHLLFNPVQINPSLSPHKKQID